MAQNTLTRSPKKKAPALPEMTKDPLVSAKAAGLRYITDTGPGIRRRKAGKKFKYIGPDGEPVTSPAELTRIKALGIPPAYRDVWISPLWNGHLQATGRDEKGRKQYRYHPRWRQVRDETKYGRMIAFGEALPKIRERVALDLARPGMPREKTLATIVKLLEETHIRIGNEEYAKTNEHYGLTTLHNEHVDVEGSTVHFRFKGKSGKDHEIDLRDRKLAKIIKRCQDLPGQDLFEYVDKDGQNHTVGSSDVNAYLHEITGQDFTAKDFRTWAGTILAARALSECEAAGSQTQCKKIISQVIKGVAKELGNTPAICRKCYVHPAVLDAYTDGSLLQALSGQAEQFAAESSSPALRAEETAMMSLLRERLSCETPPEAKKPPSKRKAA